MLSSAAAVVKEGKRPARVVVWVRTSVCEWEGVYKRVWQCSVTWLTARLPHRSCTHTWTHTVTGCRLSGTRCFQVSSSVSHSVHLKGLAAGSFHQRPGAVSDVLLVSLMWIRSERTTNEKGIGPLGQKTFADLESRLRDSVPVILCLFKFVCVTRRWWRVAQISRLWEFLYFHTGAELCHQISVIFFIRFFYKSWLTETTNIW